VVEDMGDALQQQQNARTDCNAQMGFEDTYGFIKQNSSSSFTVNCARRFNNFFVRLNLVRIQNQEI
jgi:hypothetical protein